MRPSVRRQQAVHQGLQAIGLVDDDLCVFGQVFALQFHFEQLRGTANTAQRVLDLVGQIADQLLIGLRLLQQALFALLSGLLLHWQQFDNHLVRTVRGGNDDVHRQMLGVVQAAQCSLIAQGRKLVVTHALQRVEQGAGIDKMLRQCLPLQTASGLAQHILERGIHADHTAMRVQNGHRRGQQIKRSESQCTHRWVEEAGRRAISRSRLSMSRWDRSIAA